MSDEPFSWSTDGYHRDLDAIETILNAMAEDAAEGAPMAGEERAEISILRDQLAALTKVVRRIIGKRTP